MSLLLDMLFGAVVQYKHAHFATVRCGKFLDAAAVKGRTQLFLGIQTDTFHFFFLFLHFFHPIQQDAPKYLPLQQKITVL